MYTDIRLGLGLGSMLRKNGASNKQCPSLFFTCAWPQPAMLGISHSTASRTLRPPRVVLAATRRKDTISFASWLLFLPMAMVMSMPRRRTGPSRDRTSGLRRSSFPGGFVGKPHPETNPLLFFCFSTVVISVGSTNPHPPPPSLLPLSSPLSASSFPTTSPTGGANTLPPLRFSRVFPILV